jgi:predicted transglutaminase-like cysteine proteinase
MSLSATSRIMMLTAATVIAVAMRIGTAKPRQPVATNAGVEPRILHFDSAERRRSGCSCWTRQKTFTGNSLSLASVSTLSIRVSAARIPLLSQYRRCHFCGPGIEASLF